MLIKIIASLLLFSISVFASDMADEERYVKQGEVAENAGGMRFLV